MNLNKHQKFILILSALSSLACIWVGNEFKEYVRNNGVTLGETIFALSLQFSLLLFGIRYFIKAFKEAGND